ncbi:MAG: quinohemoprotein amine dehydrogenase maturation protein [Gammaproteobacteria bacterium]
MTTLRFIPTNAHDVQVGTRRVLFHIPTTSLFDLDDVSGAVYDLFKEQKTVSSADVRSRFDGRFPAGAVVDAIQEFLDLQIVSDGRPVPTNRPALKIKEYPLSTLVLNVNTGCNLGCTYCYKEDLATPAKGEKMDFETARSSIELLLREGGARSRINVVFFGGEPLTNLPLIKKVVDYAERRAEEEGKTVDFSLTTNATLLTEDNVDYLNRHRFGVSVSIDGPKWMHDRHRVSVRGQGTYDVVAKKVKMLLARYTARPIGARVTITSGNTDVVAIHDHLIGEMGFYEAGYAPVTANKMDLFNLNGAELAELFKNMKILGERYRQAALRGENTGFSNLHQLMADLYQGTRKSLPCGAGVGLLAVDKDGELNLCHRFTGSSLPTYGNVADGIDKKRLGAFLEAATDRSGKVCETCRIRNLCAGGCYHESYAHFSDPLSPTYHYCDLMRDWIDFGIGIYTQVLERNPEFFTRHIVTRSPSYEALEIA